MKKKLAVACAIFLVCAFAVKAIDIKTKYDMYIWDYIRYSMPLTEEEKEFLNSNKIKYGIATENPPFAFATEESEQGAGMLKDCFAQISVMLETEFTPVLYDKYYLALELKREEIDAAAINKTPVNESVFLFTQALYVERSKILVNEESEFRSIDDVRDISIAVTAGSTAHHEANSFFEEDKNVDLILTQNLDESLRLFGMKEVDAIIGDEFMISYYLNRNVKDSHFRFLDGALSEEEIGVAVNKDQKILYSILNKGILEIKKDGQYAHIYSKWFGNFMPEISNFSASDHIADMVILMIALSYVFVFWNMTVRDKVNIRTRELKESRVELYNIVNSLYDGIIVTDSKGEIQVCNGAALEILKTDNEHIAGRSVHEVDGIKPFLAHVDQQDAFKLGGKYYLVSDRELKGTSGKRMFVIEDYTARYKYESLTRQEAKMIAVGELSAGLAHEIRNPLGIIKNYIYIIKKKMSGSVEKYAADAIDNSVDRINVLIENLLSFSRLSRENAGTADVKELLSQIVALERKRLEKNNIKIEVNIWDNENHGLYINEDVFRLAVVNLINNSVDALNEADKEDKKIFIDIRRADGKLFIDFKDNGKGIPKGNIEEIFNPFFTTKETGTGLGLYIVASEIREAGGSIMADSIEGVSTSFHIVLPAEKERADG